LYTYAIGAESETMKTKKTWTKPKLMVFHAGRAENGKNQNISDGSGNSKS
jgi:hypothetical protein